MNAEATMHFDGILNGVAQYYTEKVMTHGSTARGVDWNSPESQVLRFEQLMKVRDADGPFSVNDYGCGYGALVKYMTTQGYVFHYRGFDIAAEMIARAKELYRDLAHCEFFARESSLSPADYTVASGIFNVKLQATNDEWQQCVLHTLGHIAKLSRRGFAFNVLTRYSDPERMRPDLYYADPLFLFDYCKEHFSRFVALLHDYPLHEFTILVRM